MATRHLSLGLACNICHQPIPDGAPRLVAGRLVKCQGCGSAKRQVRVKVSIGTQIDRALADLAASCNPTEHRKALAGLRILVDAIQSRIDTEEQFLTGVLDWASRNPSFEQPPRS